MTLINISLFDREQLKVKTTLIQTLVYRPSINSHPHLMTVLKLLYVRKEYGGMCACEHALP